MPRSCEATVTVAAPPPAAFEALLTPSAVRAYWGASQAVIAPVVGGIYSLAWGDPDEPAYAGAHEILALEPPTHLALRTLSYYARDGAPAFDLETRIAYRLTPTDDGGCRIRVVQSGFPDDAGADAFLEACQAGWGRTLAQLAAYLADPRPA